MKPSNLLVLFSWLAVSHAAAVPPPPAPKFAVSKRWAQGDPDPPQPKFFHEPRDQSHYDLKYFREPLSAEEQKQGIKTLVQTYLATFRDLNVQTWLMHGSLLGWWWGKNILPWDFDADVQVTEADMHFLAAYYNMTIYYYQYEGAPEGRYFLLKVNPHFKSRDLGDNLNVIDARWIDMQNGLYIDITAARYSLNHPKGRGVLHDKNGHEYKDKFVFPLLDTTFEGFPAKIPFRYKEVLESEYGTESLRSTSYRGHTFDSTRMKWVKDDEESVHAGL